MIAQRSFPEELTSVPRARRFVAATLAEYPETVLESATLIVSELVTNCIRHAHTGFDVDIDAHEGRIRIAITDGGDGEPQVQTPGPTDRSGRGLRIVDLLASEWGVVPATPQRGKTVWFRLRIDNSHLQDAK